MGIEKDYQVECFHSLQYWGYGQKQVQDATKCPKCYSVVYPHHKGYADYHGEILSGGKLLPLKIECKVGKERFNFSEIRDDQREYLDWYTAFNAAFPSTAYIWLQLGVGRVNAQYMPRRVWLVQWEDWKEMEALVKDEFKCAYIPYSQEIATEFNMRVKYGARNLLPFWELDYVSEGKRWRAGPGCTERYLDYFG